MKRYFNKTILVDLRAKFKTVEDRANSLLLRYTNHQFKNVHAREYARQGFARRVGTLRRCIENIFRVIPPGAVKVPNKSKLHDAQINLHAFMANVYGCVDNLAWVWVHERGLTERISRRQVGLRKNNIQVRSSLSKEFQNYLQGLDKWLDYVTEYRDSLAHRIPLYIPPGNVPPRNVDAYNDLMRRMNEALSVLNPFEYEELAAKQHKLLVFQPLMTHSLKEATARVVFHVQVIADFITVDELGQRMLTEIKR